MTSKEPPFDEAQAETDRELAEARQEMVDRFQAIKAEHGGFTKYEAACLLVPTYPLTDEFGHALQRLEGTAESIEYYDGRIEAAYNMDGGNRLRPINRKEPPTKWRYDPAALLAWAEFTQTGHLDIAREVIPTEEVNAAEAKRSQRHGQADRWSSQRERMFAAAVALLIVHPNKCKDKRGKITAKSVADAVDHHAFLFFEEGEDPLAADTIADHIRQWTAKLRR